MNHLGIYKLSLIFLPVVLTQRSRFWLKISKKPQLYEHTASFFKDFYLKNILLN